jgi:hypothetical protein
MKKFTFALTIVISVFLFKISVSANTGIDIVGWDKAKWCMSKSQLEKIYQLDGWHEKHPPRCFFKKKQMIEGQEYMGAFWFDKRSDSGKLIKCHFYREMIATNKFDSIKKIFLKKYGDPDSDVITTDDTRVVRWAKPSGEVSILNMSHSKYIFIEFIMIDQEKNFDFRKIKWGMKTKAVKNAEKLKPIVVNKKILAYDIKVLGRNMSLVYKFSQGRLVEAAYVLDEKHTNKNDYITQYRDLVSALYKKYGIPIEEESTWRNDLYREDRSSRGLAVSIGHLVYYTTWDIAKTKIKLELFGDNYEITCRIKYVGKQMKKYKEAEKNDQIQEQL